MRVIAKGGRVFLEAHETYRKQSYRNRFEILSSSGVLSLSIPLNKGTERGICSMTIDYTKPWLQQHERALAAAYNSSPFFEYYKDDLFAILESGEVSLYALNERLLVKIIDLIGLGNNLSQTDRYLPAGDVKGITDLRDSFHPKNKSGTLLLDNAALSDFYTFDRYYQVFSGKFDFVENLSILDLLFNEGPNSISYLL